MRKETIQQLEQYKPTVASSINWHIPRLLQERAKLLEACKQLLATGSFRKNGDQGEAAAQRAQSAIAFAESE